MHALVTGGTGFIGSHLVASLIARGWRVRCLVRPTSQRKPLAAYDVEYIVGALQDRESLRYAVRDIDVVFHLAGATRVRVATDYERINSLGTQNLIEACAASSPHLRKFLLISSIAAAGPSRTGTALTEDQPPCPAGPYGRSKLLAEEIVLAYKEHLPVIVLRPSAIYGPGDTDFFQLFQAIKYGILPHIGRQDLHLDLCFVSDLVHRIVTAAEHRNGLGDVFFLGGTCHTWRTFGHAIGQQMGVRPRELRLPRALVLAIASLADGWAILRQQPSILGRANLTERLQPFWVCDDQKAAGAFGHTPRTQLSDGIAQTLCWYRQAKWL
ncbi:MAG: NAD-dependent epimerase/dehydratase family protein [bacterium]|nr:NAD-dependent epimerase/dehydratase family protein [bacterium]